LGLYTSLFGRRVGLLAVVLPGALSHPQSKVEKGGGGSSFLPKSGQTVKPRSSAGKIEPPLPRKLLRLVLANSSPAGYLSCETAPIPFRAPVRRCVPNPVEIRSGVLRFVQLDSEASCRLNRKPSYKGSYLTTSVSSSQPDLTESDQALEKRHRSLLTGERRLGLGSASKRPVRIP